MDELKQMSPDVADFIEDWAACTNRPVPNTPSEILVWLKGEKQLQEDVNPLISAAFVGHLNDLIDHFERNV
jgi:hypothetical protein